MNINQAWGGGPKAPQIMEVEKRKPVFALTQKKEFLISAVKCEHYYLYPVGLEEPFIMAPTMLLMHVFDSARHERRLRPTPPQEPAGRELQAPPILSGRVGGENDGEAAIQERTRRWALMGSNKL